MSYLYLHAWQNGPGRYESNGNVAVVVRGMVCAASHIHAAHGFPFNAIRFWEA